MSRKATGQITVLTLADGTRAFKLRFRANGRRESRVLHERRDCDCGCGGGWNDRTAAVELENTLARINPGVWRKRQRVEPAVPARVPTFHEYASSWLQAKKDGSIGDRPIDAHTAADYRWRLAKHLLPFFARCPLDEIDPALCQEFKAAKLREAAEIRDALQAGAVLRDQRRRRVRPLGPASIRKLIDCLASIAWRRFSTRRSRTVTSTAIPLVAGACGSGFPSRARSFLEMDELVALTDAAAEQDAELIGPREYVGRRAVVATLGRADLRASELCDVRLRDVRLHDTSGARLRIPDAKTEAGIREVQLSPDLVDELVAHIDRLRRAGLPTGPDAYLFPNVRGGRMSRQRVAEIVREAAERATARFVERGLPRFRTQRRTASGAPASRSRCSQTGSTSCGS
jgi:integrase